MAHTVYLYVDDEGVQRAKNLNTAMGYVAWNIAVMIAPYDTGNLRNSITLKRNTSKRMVLSYNLTNANYIKFLELGQGSVKKYQGFISRDTLNEIGSAYMSYIQNGSIPAYTKTPNITLKSTSNIFSTERQLLRDLGVNSERLNANVRRSISRAREKEYRLQNGIPFKNQSGQKPTTTRGTTTRDWNYSNKGIGVVNKFGASLREIRK